MASLPLWERGLKSHIISCLKSSQNVAPLVGAWIEISCTGATATLFKVAPLVGAWIEILLPLFSPFSR